MGQKTFESIGRPLPNRTNIILTKDSDLKIPGCIIYHDPDEAIEESKKYSDEVFICGGGQIYNLFINRADKLYLTRILEDVKGDVHLEGFDENEWGVIEKSENIKENNITYRFEVYEKKL